MGRFRSLFDKLVRSARIISFRLLNNKIKNDFALLRQYIQHVDKFVQEHKHEPDFSFDYGDRAPSSRSVQKTPKVYGTPRDYFFLEYIDIINPKYYFLYSPKKNN